jgi:hypothetical protein
MRAFSAQSRLRLNLTQPLISRAHQGVSLLPALDMATSLLDVPLYPELQTAG